MKTGRDILTVTPALMPLVAKEKSVWIFECEN